MPTKVEAPAVVFRDVVRRKNPQSEKSVTLCEPPEDCVNCRRRGFCRDFEFWEDDVQEIEERLEAERESIEESEEESDEGEEDDNS